MKIMRSTEEKTTSGGGSHNNSSNNTKIRIAVFGQHDVGKSALTVRYLTRRYIGEYKSNTDMLYRQTMTVSHEHSVDIEIVDISTSEDSSMSKSTGVNDRDLFPTKELQRADGFIIVYSITDRTSFTFAMDALAKLSTYYQNQSQQPQTKATPQSTSFPSNMHPTPNNKSSSLPVVLIANKNDLEHLRTVEKVEGLTASMQFSTHFFELSVAENSPEVYTSFQTIISTFAEHQPSKRKFSVSKMFGNLRLGRTSPSQQIAVGHASIIDNSYESSMDSTNEQTNSLYNNDCSHDYNNSYQHSSKSHTHACRQSSSTSTEKESTSSVSNLSSSICNLKSKLVEFHSMKKRHNSPPICSL